MKRLKIIFPSIIKRAMLCLLLTGGIGINGLMAQDAAVPAADKAAPLNPVKNTFEDIILIDNQTAQLPIKNTFEFMLQHRFGDVTNGYKDFYGLFAGANMAFKFFYCPVKDLNLGIALNEENMQWEGSAKYALMKQSETGGWPVSITYFGNVAIDSRPKEGNFVSDVDRYSYFNQFMVARKITEKFSAQAAVSISHYNNIPGYYNADSSISPTLKNEQVAMEFLGRYKISEIVAVIGDYDQPMTQNPMNNPHPSVSFGFEFSTKGHAFQIFATNYGSTLAKNNNFFNQNDTKKGEWLIGFNLTRKWHF